MSDAKDSSAPTENKPPSKEAESGPTAGEQTQGLANKTAGAVGGLVGAVTNAAKTGDDSSSMYVFCCGPSLDEAWATLIPAGLSGCLDCQTTGENEWTYPWYSVCFNDIALTLLMCPWCCGHCMAPVLHARNMHHLEWSPYEGACLAFCCTCCCSSCYLAGQRTRVREKYGLKGSTFGDFAIMCCVPFCGLCQEATEIGKQSDYVVPWTKIGADKK